MKEDDNTEKQPDLDAKAENADAGKPDAEFEPEAIGMGWRPLEEWKDDPSKWRSAKDFVTRGREIQPILRASNKRLEAKLQKLEAELADKDRAIGEIREFNSKTEERAYNRALEKLRTDRKGAIEKGDGDAFDKADEQIRELEEARPKKEAKPNGQQQPQKPDVVLEKWFADNRWYGQNKNATRVANGIGHELRQEQPGLVGQPFLEELNRRMRDEMPEVYTDPRRDRPATVEGAGNGAQRRSGKKSAADLPAEVREQGQRFVKQKLFKDLDAYAAEYFSQE